MEQTCLGEVINSLPSPNLLEEDPDRMVRGTIVQIVRASGAFVWKDECLHYKCNNELCPLPGRQTINAIQAISLQCSAGKVRANTHEFVARLRKDLELFLSE